MRDDGFVKRTKEILFCRIEDTQAYFIKIAPHGRSVPPPWAKQELVEIIHENWPDTISSARVSNVSSLAVKLNDEDRRALRRANGVTFLDMADGTIYIEPGIGRTMGGLHWNDLSAADDIRRFTKRVETQVANEWPHIIENARRLGYFPKEPVSLTMLETNPQLALGYSGSGKWVPVFDNIWSRNQTSYQIWKQPCPPPTGTPDDEQHG